MFRRRDLMVKILVLIAVLSLVFPLIALIAGR